MFSFGRGVALYQIVPMTIVYLVAFCCFPDFLSQSTDPCSFDIQYWVCNPSASHSYSQWGSVRFHTEAPFWWVLQLTVAVHYGSFIISMIKSSLPVYNMTELGWVPTVSIIVRMKPILPICHGTRSSRNLTDTECNILFIWINLLPNHLGLAENIAPDGGPGSNIIWIKIIIQNNTGTILHSSIV